MANLDRDTLIEESFEEFHLLPEHDEHICILVCNAIEKLILKVAPDDMYTYDEHELLTMEYYADYYGADVEDWENEHYFIIVTRRFHIEDQGLRKTGKHKNGLHLTDVERKLITGLIHKLATIYTLNFDQDE